MVPGPKQPYFAPTSADWASVRLGLDRADEVFDRIARIAQRQAHATISAIALLSPSGVVLPGAAAMPDVLQRVRRIDRAQTITSRVVELGHALVLADASTDPRIAPAAAAYGAPGGAVAAFPIFADSSAPVGALVAINDTPGPWPADALANLRDLAQLTSQELRLRLALERARAAESVARAANDRAQLLLSLSEAFVDATTAREVERVVTNVMVTSLGAASCRIALLDADRRGLTYVSQSPLAVNQPWGPSAQRVRLSDELPVCEAARTGRAAFFESAMALRQRYPMLSEQLDFAGACSQFPIKVGHRVVAVMCTRWARRRKYDRDTATLEATLAPYVAHALERAALLEARRQVAATLQKALLTDPPEVAGLAIATIYEPARRTDQVGGDWYDVVAISPDTTLLTIGDVAGHDVRAAAAMGQLRSMLRVLAWSQVDPMPSGLLSLLDRANHELGPGAGATAIVVRLDRRGDGASGYAMTWSNAGHLPPMVLRADGTVETLSTQAELLLGVLPGSRHRDHTSYLAPGETLLLYTDGLVESRVIDLEERMEELREALASTRNASTATVPGTLVGALLELPQRDDIAVLAVRARVPTAFSEEVPTGELAPDTVARTLGDLAPSRRWLDDALEAVAVSGKGRSVASLLLSEVLTNALEHGAPPVTTSIELLPAAGRVRISVRDQSLARPVLRHPSPSDVSGRGLLFLDRLAAAWGVENHRDGKTVWFEVPLVG